MAATAEPIDAHPVVVVGGGIAGLHAARELASQGYRVKLYETRDAWGGRIETADLHPGPDGKGPFKAEFGPMRFEPELQPRFDWLRKDLDFEYEDFPPPDAATPGIVYPLSPEEKSPLGLPLDSLRLLKLGVLRLLGHDPRVVDAFEAGRQFADVRLSQAAQDWLDSFNSPLDFDRLRRDSKLLGTKTPLYEVGFWNALYHVLSPAAVAYIMNFGTFYHLMPDNPNAVEWAIFWVRLFKLGSRKLKTIPDGVAAIVTALIEQLKLDPLIELELGCTVTAVRPHPGGAEIEVVTAGGHASCGVASHVVLALPKQPLQELRLAVCDRVRDYLDSVIAFTLLKVFAVIETPAWWLATPPPQTGAWLCPTREIHYMPAIPPGSRHDNTMILLYMDHPAVAFWQHYVADRDHHHRSEINANRELKEAVARVLYNLHYAHANELLRSVKPPAYFARDAGSGLNVIEAFRLIYDRILRDLSPDEEAVLGQRHPALVDELAEILLDKDSAVQTQLRRIHDYAIRDWSRAPFGAASHAWKPGAKSWEVRAQLRAFAFAEHPELSCLHVCGEAYSEYQGFIEGALESAEDAVIGVLTADGRMTDAATLTGSWAAKYGSGGGTDAPDAA